MADEMVDAKVSVGPEMLDPGSARGSAMVAEPKVAGADVVCPECGTPVRGRPAVTGGGQSRLSRRLSVVLIVAVLVAVVLMSWKTTASQSSIVVAPSPFFSFALPGIDFAKLRQIEAGAGDGKLTAQIARQTTPRVKNRPGHIYLITKFSLPDGQAWEQTNLGWPIPWAIVASSAMYDDAIARLGLSDTLASASSSPQSRLYWPDAAGVSYVRSWGTTGTPVKVVHVRFAGVAVAAVLIIAAWHLGRAIRFLLARRARDGKLGRARAYGWFVRRLPIVLAVVVLLAEILGTATTASTISSAWSMMPVAAYHDPVWRSGIHVERDSTGKVLGVLSETPDSIPTMLTDLDVRGMHKNAASDAAIARAVLDAWGGAVDPSGWLAFGFDDDTTATEKISTIGWPWTLIDWRGVTRDWKEEAWRVSRILKYPAGPWHFVWHEGYLVMMPGSARESLEVHVCYFDMANIALTLMMLWSVWQIGRLMTWLWANRLKIRHRRRGRCQACGYDLAGLGVVMVKAKTP